METNGHMNIAGLSIALHDVRATLDELQSVYDQFQQRTDAFKADGCNPHLCRAGCSHCCKQGAVFAVTLVEAVQWSMAVGALPDEQREHARADAASLLEQQHKTFEDVEGSPDVPGRRDEALFSSRITRLNASGPACPLLFDDLCSVYEDRPLLCRAYGFPVDAYAVKRNDTIVFRSLCVLYEGMELSDYVRAEDVKREMTELSQRLAGGHDWGRFTSPEAILSQLERP